MPRCVTIILPCRWRPVSVDEGINAAFLTKVLGAAVVVGLTVFRLAPATGSAPPAPTSPAEDIGRIERSVYYPGCRAARAAGVAPIHRGSPGYRPEMDGDDDGIACEPHRTQ